MGEKRMSEGEGAAIALLKRAVELDLAKRYTEALVCYKEGLQLFLAVVQSITDKEKKVKYRLKASEYLDRSEKVQEIVNKEKENGKYHEHIRIGKFPGKLLQLLIWKVLRRVGENC